MGIQDQPARFGQIGPCTNKHGFLEVWRPVSLRLRLIFNFYCWRHNIFKLPSFYASFLISMVDGVSTCEELAQQKTTWILPGILFTFRGFLHIYDPGSRFATTPPPPTWYGPKTCVLQHSAWKRCICSVFCMVGCWCGPQPCKFVGFLQPTFRKRVICNVSASTSWSSAAAPSSISASNYHIILNLLLTVFSLGTGLISVYILCLSNFLLECLVFRNWSNLKFS